LVHETLRGSDKVCEQDKLLGRLLEADKVHWPRLAILEMDENLCRVLSQIRDARVVDGRRGD
jgi:hypothetical protein